MTTTPKKSAAATSPEIAARAALRLKLLALHAQDHLQAQETHRPLRVVSPEFGRRFCADAQASFRPPPALDDQP